MEKLKSVGSIGTLPPMQKRQTPKEEGRNMGKRALSGISSYISPHEVLIWNNWAEFWINSFGMCCLRLLFEQEFQYKYIVVFRKCFRHSPCSVRHCSKHVRNSPSVTNFIQSVSELYAFKPNRFHVSCVRACVCMCLVCAHVCVCLRMCVCACWNQFSRNSVVRSRTLFWVWSRLIK